MEVLIFLWGCVNCRADFSGSIGERFASSSAHPSSHVARAVSAGSAPRSAAPASTPTRRASEGGRPRPTPSLARRVGVAIPRPRSHGPRGNAVLDALRPRISAGVAAAGASTLRFGPWGFGNDTDRTKTAGAGETSDAAAALAPVDAGLGELCAPVLRIIAQPDPGTRASTEVVELSMACVKSAATFSGSLGKKPSLSPRAPDGTAADRVARGRHAPVRPVPSPSVRASDGATGVAGGSRTDASGGASAATASPDSTSSPLGAPSASHSFPAPPSGPGFQSWIRLRCAGDGLRGIGSFTGSRVQDQGGVGGERAPLDIILARDTSCPGNVAVARRNSTQVPLQSRSQTSGCKLRMGIALPTGRSNLQMSRKRVPPYSLSWI